MFTQRDTGVISENVGNLFIFREKVLDLRPYSVFAVELTMYVYWTCINRNRNGDNA